MEKSLAAGKGGVSKVYRIDVPGKDESVFGVAMTKKCSGDKFVMSNIDFKPVRSTAHLPYEMLVSGKKVYALYARFRIAINFPDLKMMGDNSFFKIMCAPDAIEEALTLGAGGKIIEDSYVLSAFNILGNFVDNIVGRPSVDIALLNKASEFTSKS